ncbi:MAG: universal stress protein [Nitrososphaerales archaeon]
MSKQTKVNKILLAIDGSKASLKAAEYAMTLANQVNASVVILHVISIPLFPRHFKSVNEYYEGAEKVAEAWFDVIKNLRQSKNLQIKTKIISGSISVVESIVDYAEKENVDMIIMGTRGRSKFTKLLGSVASGVMMHAECPVLVVKKPAKRI